MKLRLALFAALGVALALYLVTHVGWGSVLSAVVAIGWGGFALYCLCALIVFLILGTAWYVLQPGTSATGPGDFIRARMVRDAASEVLPFSQVGGMVFGARAAILHGVPAPLAGASMIVDVTTEFLAQIAYIGLGLVLLTIRAPRSSVAASVTTNTLTALSFALLAAGLFLAAQRYAPRLTTRLGAPLLRRLGPTVTGIGAALGAIYSSPARVAASGALHFTAWVTSAVGAWVGLLFMGARIDVTDAIALESLVCAIRSVGVLVPNALGVQEAAYAFAAPLFGLGPEMGLALSVLRRARDVTIGVPVLLLWQTAEGRRMLARPGAPPS